MKISVALCTFNAAKYLNQLLDSLANQSFLIDELIVCDNASDDNTVKLVEEYHGFKPNTIKLFRNETNLGFNKNFEMAISLCTGDIIFTCDADDIWKSNKVEAMIKKFAAYPAAYLIFSDAELIDSDNNPLPSTLWEKWGFYANDRELWKDNNYACRQLSLNNNKVSGPTIAFRKQLKEDIFPFDFSTGLCFDAYLALCAAKRNGLYFMDECLIQYRIHPEQQIGIGNGVYLKQMKKEERNTFSIRWQRRINNLKNKTGNLLHLRLNH
jgi:glycosyltransferase involved in cell wall biosynthesis